MNQFLSLSWFSGLTVNVVAWFQLANINLIVSILLGVLGAVAACLKIRIMLFDIQAKKQLNEKSINSDSRNSNNRGISGEV